MTVALGTREERAYNWAHEQQQRIFPEAKPRKATGITEFADEPGVHTSMFEPPDGKPGIVRITYENKGGVYYQLMDNFKEMKAAHPELINHFIKSGVAVYEKRSDNTL